MQAFLQKLFPADRIRDVFYRFFPSVVCAIGLFFLAVSQVHNWFDPGYEYIEKIYITLISGFFLLGGIKLFSESRSWSRLLYGFASVVAFVALCLFVFLSDQYEVQIVFLLPAFLLFLSVAPFLNKKEDDWSFWIFNQKLWVGAGLGVVAGLLVWAKLSVAVWAIDTLFFDVNSEVYVDAMLFSSILFAPIYALSWVPQQFNATKKEYKEPVALAFFGNWICAPAVIVYFLILYAYFLKLLFQMELPDGQVSYIVTGFAGLGIFGYLLGWPLRDSGSAFLKLFIKYFFLALIVPVAVQFYAIFVRLEAYGLTEQRYLVVMSAVWLAILIGLFLFKKPPLKIVVMVLCFLFFSGVFLAPCLSEWSQHARFRSLLSQNHILQDGQIVKTDGKLPFATRKSISSIADYLIDTNKYGVLKKYGAEENEYGYISASNFTEKLGIEYVSSYEDRDGSSIRQYSFEGHYEGAYVVSGYDYLYKIYYTEGHEGSQDIPKLSIGSENGFVTLVFDDRDVLKFDLTPYAEKDFPLNSELFELTQENKNVKVSLQVIEISYDMEEKSFGPYQRYNVFVKMK